MDAGETLLRIARLNSEYAAALDAGRLEQWPDFFTENCLYKITTAANERNGYAAGIVYADSRAMLADRVLALRKVNIYERQSYRHIMGMPMISTENQGQVTAETSFVVIRTMRDGQMDLFAAGLYRDQIDVASLRFAQRVVVCDSSRFDTLLAIPL